MKKIIRFEFMKVLKKKSFLCAVLLMIVMLIIVPCLTISENNWINEDGMEITGMVAIRAKRNALENYSCDLTTEKLQSVIINYQSAYADPASFIKEDGTASSWINNAAYAKYIQSDSDIKFLIDMAFTPQGDTYDYYAIGSMDIKDAENFYEKRLGKVEEYLNMDYSYGNYSEEDKEYFLTKNEKLTIPFHYEYNTGWNKLFGISYVSLMVIALVVCITLAPVFSSEYQTGADAILLSTKYGRSKLIVAKIVSSFLLTSVIYALGILILTFVTFLIYGIEGADCSLQVLNFLAPADVNLLQTYLYVILTGYFMCLFMQGITLLLSAKMSSPFPVIICTMVFFFVPLFLPYSRSSRTYNNILNLMPAKMAAAYTALTKYEVFHIFGLKISYPIMLILVAMFVSVITLPFAYRAFHKHQVA
ncbi:MAG: ABC transporter permease subunit [Butyrivibrio sp.]|nr:ABC transporter permease subunit [Butyrivibrio sp.]